MEFYFFKAPYTKQIRSKKHMALEVDQKYVEDIIKPLVDNPNDVKTERTVDERGVLITLHLNQADMGQIIGRMGRTARAIRTLARVFGARHNARVNLKIYEPNKPDGGQIVGDDEE